VELIAQRREARRLKALQEKAALNEERKQHGDDLHGVRFARMVDSERRGLLFNPGHNLLPTPAPAHSCAAGGDGPKVAVMVRKRPLSAKETALKAVDVITCMEGGHIVVHEPKTRVDCSRHVVGLYKSACVELQIFSAIRIY
jgi:hypothetical protein